MVTAEFAMIFLWVYATLIFGYVATLHVWYIGRQKELYQKLYQVSHVLVSTVLSFWSLWRLAAYVGDPASLSPPGMLIGLSLYPPLCLGGIAMFYAHRLKMKRGIGSTIVLINGFALAAFLTVVVEMLNN